MEFEEEENIDSTVIKFEIGNRVDKVNSKYMWTAFVRLTDSFA